MADMSSTQCCISHEMSSPPSIEINLIEATQSSQVDHLSYSPSLNESVTANTDDEVNPANASPEPSMDTGIISIDYYSPMNCDSYDSDTNNLAHSRSPSNNFKSDSVSFSYEESQSQIGQLYMKQEAAKKSLKYRMYYPRCTRRFNLPPKTSMDAQDKDYDDEEIMDRILMNRILMNYRRQESSSKDIRRGIRRAGTVQPIQKSTDFSGSSILAQSAVPLQTRIAHWRTITETEDLTPLPLSKAGTYSITPQISHFNSNPDIDRTRTTSSWNHMNMMNRSISACTQSRERSSAIHPIRAGPTISSFGLYEPDTLSEGSDDDIKFDPYFDSDEEYYDDQDEKGSEDSFEVKPIQTDQMHAELAIRRTAQLLMVSSGDSKEVFQTLWKICISLKKDPKYHISFNDKLLKQNHVEEFLRLLGFLKDKSSSRWSCFAHTRVPISLIDTAILECHKCRQIIQQRASTINLVNQHKKKRKNSGTTQRSKLSLPIVYQSQSMSQSIEDSHVFSISENEKNDSNSVQLYELIWGITHNNNDDPDAKDVLLLCYPLITNAKYILYCLQARFFKDDHDGRKTLENITPTSSGDTLAQIPQNSCFEFGRNKTKYDKILSSFSVQKNVIEFIRHWMVRFWDKDWDSDRKLMSFCKIFMRRVRKAFQSDDNQEFYEPSEIKKGLHLVDMLEKTIKTQKTRVYLRLNRILGDVSGNDGLLPSNNGANDTKPRYKKRSSLFSRGLSQKKMNKEPKNLMDVNYVIIAEQITLLQFNLFKKIHPRECLKQAWKNNDTKHKYAPNIAQFIDEFNRLTKWIQSSILSVEDVKSRGRTIKKWVKVEEELLKLRNFQSLCAVYCGLASSPIYRLKEAWSYVPKKHITQHEEIRVIMKSNRNWKNLRSLQLQTHPPMLPYFGMFAQDMIIIEETSNNRGNDGGINWDALCRGQVAIDKYLVYQKSPYNNLNPDLSVQRWMNKELTMSGILDDEYVYQVSNDVLLNDKRELGKDNKSNISITKRMLSWKSKRIL